MNTVKLVVLCAELHYAGVTRFKGETFEASLNDAKVLKLVGRAADPPAESRHPVGLVDSTVAKTKASDPEPDPEAGAAAKPADDPDAPVGARGRQGYRTRRMAAKA